MPACKLIVAITEGVPVLDMTRVYPFVQEHGRAPDRRQLPGSHHAGRSRRSASFPGRICTAGTVGVVSRSGTLTYEIVYQLTRAGIGQTTCVGIGGDPINGTNFIDCLRGVRGRPADEGRRMMGEIGGTDEQEAAEFVKQHDDEAGGRASSPARPRRRAAAWATPAPSSPARRARRPKRSRPSRRPGWASRSARWISSSSSATADAATADPRAVAGAFGPGGTEHIAGTGSPARWNRGAARALVLAESRSTDPARGRSSQCARPILSPTMAHSTTLTIIKPDAFSAGKAGKIIAHLEAGRIPGACRARHASLAGGSRGVLRGASGAPVLSPAREVHDVGALHADGPGAGRRGGGVAARRSARPIRRRRRRGRCGGCTRSPRSGTPSMPPTPTTMPSARRASFSPKRTSCAIAS